MIRTSFLTFVLCLALAGCDQKDAKVINYPDIPMIGAVMNSDIDEVRRLAAKGAGLNERAPENQATPMIDASDTDQWPVVEILIDHGADI